MLEINLTDIRHVALDLDGTLYEGGRLFDATVPFLDLLGQLGIGRTFLTNNSSKSVRDYTARFREMGIEADESDFMTSTVAALDYIRKNLPGARSLFVLGTPSMQREVAEAGYEVAGMDGEPDAVLVGFDTTLTYEPLCRAAWWIRQGKPFVATHPDRVCPTDRPTVLVDCGAMTACLEHATGRKPLAVPGKPDPGMLAPILDRHGLEACELAMVGDRIYTDMEMARRTGALGVLVLSGETSAEDAEAARPRPDLVLSGIAEFGAMLAAARQKETGA